MLNRNHIYIGIGLIQLLLLQATLGLAQDPIYRTYGEINGLRGKSLFHCFQDSHKNLWVASDYGAAKLKGTKFQKLEYEQGMPEMAVLRVTEDVKGNLWFFTISGTPAKFDGKKVTTQWGEKFSKEIRGANYISAFAAEKDGSVVFGTQDGRAFRIFPEGNSELLFAKEWGTVTHIDVETDGDLFFQFSKLFGTATWSHGQLTFHEQQPKIEPWTYGSLRTTRLDNGRYLNAVENRVILTERVGDTLRHVLTRTLQQRYSVYVGQDWKKNIWIGTTDGVLQFFPEDTLLQNPRTMLSGEAVSSVCRDHESNIWFTTSEGLKQCKNENILTSNPQVCRQDDEATTVHASADGMVYLGFSRGKIQQIDRKTLKLVHEYPNAFDNPTPRIVRILDVPGGGLLVASYGGLLFIRNGEAKLLSKTRISDISLHGEQVCGCLFAGWATFSLRDLEDPAKISELLKTTVAKKGSRCLRSQYDKKGGLWISSFSEVILSKGSRIDTLFKQNLLDAGYKNSFLLSTKSGWYMFGTSNHGLFMFNKGNGFILDKKKGLSDNHVVGVLEESSGSLWVLTSIGMSKVSLANGEPRILKTIGRTDHFGGAEVRDLVILHDTLWAAAGNGYVTFPVGLIDAEVQPPSVELTDVVVNGSEQDYVGELDLPYDQNSLRIAYLAKTFTSPELIEYRYKINGGSDEKFVITTATTLEFPNLAPGKYTLEIQARHPSSEWGSAQSILRFRINPPFWQTTWFKILMALLVLGIAALIIWRVIEDLRRKASVRESLLLARHDALITQMNPHFIFNSLNSIQNFILSHQIEAANDYLGDFAALMRSMLANGRKNSISIFDEVRFLTLYLKLEALRLDNKFDFQIVVSKGLATGSIYIPPMMLQPLLENAIWHGVAKLEHRKGKIDLEISAKGEILECTVRDNGIGRVAATEIYLRMGKQHESFATTILRERIDLMNRSQVNQMKMEIYDLKNEDGTPSGTEVKLFIPIQQKREGAV